MSPVLKLAGINRTYQQGNRAINVLRGLDLTLKAGEIVALLGPSGSGKSTLLHIAGLLEHANAGTVQIDGKDCGKLSNRERTMVRRNEIGFIYQFHHLLQEFTALENVMIPMRIAGLSASEAEKKAGPLLDAVGLKERKTHLPSQLSGGEQQRVAIARAMANSPQLILADEPTGNLDEATAEKVFNNLVTTARNKGMAALVATHNRDLAKRMDRVLTLHDGKIAQGV